MNAISFSRAGIVEIDRPERAAITLAQMVERLARQIRFNGEPGALSIAQHSVFGAEALAAEGAPAPLPALFLWHDAHEAVLGDLTSPAANAIALTVPDFCDTWQGLKAVWDIHIYALAGLPRPSEWPEAWHRAIKAMDLRMLGLEGRALYGPRFLDHVPREARKTPLISTGLKAWPAELATEKFLQAHQRYTGRMIR